VICAARVPVPRRESCVPAPRSLAVGAAASEQISAFYVSCAVPDIFQPSGLRLFASTRAGERLAATRSFDYRRD